MAEPEERSEAASSAPGTEPLGDPAEELFAEFLARREGGEELEFEAFAAEHDSARSGLVELHSLWLRFEQLAEDLSRTERGARGRRAAPAPEQPPEHPRYRVERIVGEGGMGVVFRVHDTLLDRRLAMKVVRLGHERPSGATATLSRPLARFLEEARVTSRLDHPGVVPIHELGRDARGRAFFTMRLVEGQTLRELFERFERGDPDWPRERILDVLRRACETVAYAHSRGVIHRDLKPANVMVGRFGEAYVMDWGLARVLGEDPARDERRRELAALLFEEAPEDVEPTEPLATMVGDVVGTPSYMPPEQAEGRLDELGPAADVYALGAMLYHLVAGRAAYAEAGDARRRLAALRAGPPARLAGAAPSASPELVAIAERAMAREPRARYRDVGELARDLRAFLEGRVVQAYERGAWAELRKWIGRNRRLAAAGGLALVAAAAAVGTLFVRSAEQQLSQRYQDLERIDDLEAELEGLWPALPSELPRLESFVARAEELVARYPAGSLPSSEQDGSPPRPDLERDARAWSQVQFAELARRVESLQAPLDEGGALPSVRARIATARAIAELERGPEWAELWADVRRRLARSAGEDGAMQPIPGLLPLGPDPVSGFEAFEHLPSASLERLEAGLAALRDSPFRPPRAGQGVVLVRIPSGRLDPGVGARGADGSLPERLLAADVEPREVPAVLLAVYELTYAQAGRLGNRPAPAEYALQPIRGVSANGADRLARAAGLRLPSRDEWLRGASGGADTVFWWGDDPSEWPEREVFGLRSAPEPVGSLPPNPFGLHDCLGNVLEWGAEPGLTVDRVPDPSSRVTHGASFNYSLEFAVDNWRLRALGFSKGVSEQVSFGGLRLALDA